MCSTRTGLARSWWSLQQHPAHGVAITGAKNWFLTADWSVHQHEQKRGNSRQPTGMAGHVSPYIRIPFFDERGPGVGVDLSLQERLDEMFANKNGSQRIDIGFKRSTDGLKDLDKKWKKESRSLEMEKAAREGTLEVDIEEVKTIMAATGEVYENIYKSAELYGVYEDLFREGYFHPCVDLDIAFAKEDEIMVPVFRGNIIKPREAATQPEVTWSSKEDDIWCLVLTGLDTHLTQEGQEYVHWMVANIKGSDLSSGKELYSYLQPFPPHGTGFHRYAFVLYKQDRPIDVSGFTHDKSTTNLSERSFSTYEFYKNQQDNITPAGLAFFQSDWDNSLRDFFHNTLNMKEPRYEYEFMAPYIQPWNRWEMRNMETRLQGFNEFLDEHRDPKDIEKEVLLKKLAHTHPYKGDTEAYMKYPLAHEEDFKEYLPAPMGEKPFMKKVSKKVPSWRHEQILKEKMKQGYFSSTDHAELRKDPMLSAQ
jgi:large subunit ribosomal protein L38